MILDAKTVLELALQRIEEPALHVQARHLVLVLVGHQLEQRVRDRLGQRLAVQAGFGTADFATTAR